jgi:hypothetical protein
VSVVSDGQNARPRHAQPEASQGGVREAALGDKDQAFQWLNTAYQEHEKALMGLKTDNSLDPLRSDRRCADLLRRIGLPQLQ